MRIGIYNRYWNTRGGGEKHSGAAAEALSADHEVDLISHEPFEPAQVARALNLDLSRTRRVLWPNVPDGEATELTRPYDVFVNSTYGSCLPSRAQRSAYLVFFPQAVNHSWLARFSRRGPPSSGFLRTYSVLIANSDYTRAWIKRRWKRAAVTLPPPVDVAFFRAPPDARKDRRVLSVGRFFEGSGNKKHREMIAAFRRLCDRGLLPPGWRLRLVGNVHRERPEHVAYFDQVTSLAQGYPIDVLPDLPIDELRAEYHAAAIYWHAAGWQEDDARNPERMEHFGISTCEAMSAGCVPVVIAKAGQLELVEDAINGFTFLDEGALIERTLQCMRLHEAGELVPLARAAASSTARFDRAHFGQRARHVLLAKGCT